MMYTSLVFLPIRDQSHRLATIRVGFNRHARQRPTLLCTDFQFCCTSNPRT